MTYNSIQEIKAAYQAKWKQQKAAKRVAKRVAKKAIPAIIDLPETKVDYDKIAQETYEIALAQGVSQRQALKLYKMIKKGR